MDDTRDDLDVCLDLHADEAAEFYNKYEPKEILGRGLSSVVRRCILRETGREYAVKIIDMHVDEAVRQSIVAEIDVLTQLPLHKHIIFLQDHFESSTFHFLVFELARGGELFGYLTQMVKLSEKKTRHIMLQLLLAVEHMHSNDIVHRDLKPENILMDDNFELKVSDFGFSAKLEPDQKLSELLGTPGYLAPEMLKVSVEDDAPGYAGMHYFKMRIECSGKPIVLSLSNQGDYEVDMVLATLVEPEPQGVPSSSQISTVVGMWTGTLPEAGDSEEIKSTSQQEDETAEEGDVIDDGFDVVEFENPSPIPSPPPTVQLVEGESLKGSLSTTDSTQGTEHLSTQTGTSVLREEDKDSLEDADFGFIKRGHANPYSKSHQLTDELFGDTEDEISDSLVIPGTPEAKRYKDSIWDNYQSQPGEEGGLVLAPDSDPKD